MLNAVQSRTGTTYLPGLRHQLHKRLALITEKVGTGAGVALRSEETRSVCEAVVVAYETKDITNLKIWI